MSCGNALRVACGQMCSSSNIKSNAKIVKKLIDKAISQDVKVLFLPEATDYIAKDSQESMNLAHSVDKDFVSVIQQQLKSLHATGKDLYVAVGVHQPSDKEPSNPSSTRRVQNNQLWINNEGEILRKYQKVHLFDINIENGPILKESNSVEPGNQIVPPFDISPNFNQFKLGLSTCYDIRFPEMCLRLRLLGANIIVYPSAFTTKTGAAHWQTLSKARAIDSQCYVINAAQCGKHDTGSSKIRESYGNSLIIDPWGDVIAQCKRFDEERSFDADGDYYELCVADLNARFIESIRKNMPLMDHRRPDVYSS